MRERHFRGGGISRRQVLTAMAAGALLPFGQCFSGCRRGERAAGVMVAGSTSVQPLAELIAEHYELEHADRAITVQGGGSSAGIRATEEGTADIGMSSRDLKPEELSTGLTPILIARDAIALIVHPSNPIRSLTKARIRDLFTGDSRRWSDVGGTDHTVTVITREEGSGTRGAFEDLIMEKRDFGVDDLVQDSTGTVRAIVASDPNAIGYISLGMVTSEVAIVAVDGVVPTHETAADGRYALARPFLFLTKGEPSEPAHAFIDYVLGPRGQELATQEGYIAAGEGGAA